MKHEKVHPVFQVEKDFPLSEVVLITSEEPTGEATPEVEENLREIKSIFVKRGIPARELNLVIKHFWENVAVLAVEILATGAEQQVVLNFSTGRRVLVSTMLLAGSFALGWQPRKKIICVQTSKNYPGAVVFEPVPPLIPDLVDRHIMSKISENSRITTSQLANELDKGQSTVSVRMKKLTEAGYLGMKGHSKEILPKGKAILGALDEIVERKLLLDVKPERRSLG
ncbi:MAG: winged helix-turn-helix transcriptional regulator [Candidatus Odinarchaeota archaeon]